MKTKGFDLEERLIDFAVRIITVSEALPPTKAGNHMANQLVRSGTSPALNYGEAQGAESKSDFIHKFKVVLKELRETSESLRISKRLGPAELEPRIAEALDECNQLIAIFVASIQTARGHRNKEGRAQ